MFQQTVVGLIGLKGAGKDTCASFLIEERGFLRVAFADKLYQEAADAYGVTVAFMGLREQKEKPLLRLQLKRCADMRFRQVGLIECAKEQGRSVRKALQNHRWVNRELRKFRSPRWVLQKWGTEYRRKLDDDSYWLNQVKAVIDANPEQNFVITDVRFSNEANFVGGINGVLVRIRRPSLEAQAEADRKAKGTAAHPSETELLNWPTNHTFVNEEGQPQMLKDAVLAAF